MTQNTSQQIQTLDYFRRNAEVWKARAEGDLPAFNIIKGRNDFVLQVARERKVERFLDVGCGTGDLVDEMSGIAESTGVDYADEMIQIARQKEGHFVCASIFDFDMGASRFDLISANGFIEYISQAQMLTFFERAAAALTTGGSFVVGSRNRLFNLVSMNRFTREEFESGGFDMLLDEAINWAEGSTQGEPAPLQHDETTHAHTGIGVNTRYQYTPLQLINILRERGLHADEIYPVHIHVNPAFQARDPANHVQVANDLQTRARGHNGLLANASTFMLHALKR